MKFFAKCPKCGRRGFIVRYRTFMLPIQRVPMKSKSPYCGRCTRELRKAFDLMDNQKDN